MLKFLANKIIFFFGIILTILFLPKVSLAADWYVDNIASGSNNGTSWTNAWQSFAAITWGSIQPGDTIYISGGTTSKTYNGMLNVQASGVAGNSIIIKTGQSSPHNGTVILDGGDVYGINIWSQSWVTISGQLGSNETPNMIVRNHIDDEVRLSALTGIVIEYLEIGPNTADELVYILNGYIGGSNRIHHNKIHDSYDYAILVRQAGGTVMNDDYLRIDHNEIYNFGHDGIHADKSNGITIDHNDIHTAASGANQNSVYSDGMHLRGLQYLTVAYNKVYDIEGPDHMYSYIFVECDPTCGTDPANTDGVANNVYVYNNLIYETNPQPTDDSNNTALVFACRACTSITAIRYLNNTTVDSDDWGISFGSNTSNITDAIIANNIFYNHNLDNVVGSRYVVELNVSGATTGSFGDAPIPAVIWDYNLVDIYSAGSLNGRYGTTLYTYENWKTVCGCDDHGVTTDPSFVSWVQGDGGDFHLSGLDIAAKDSGVTLMEFSDDMDGTSRPQGLAWDIGAYEYIEAAPPPLKGDFNSDSKVNNADFLFLKNVFKNIVSSLNAIFDLNSDNAIDVKDLGVLMSGWLP